MSMRRAQGVLSRVSQGQLKGPYSRHLDEESYADSIRQNIERMLNVRQGSLAHMPDFGLPDFNDLIFEFPDALLQLVRAVESYLLTYEHRLTNVEVGFDHPNSDPLIVKLRIQAEFMVPGGGPRRLVFSTILTGSGQAYVPRPA